MSESASTRWLKAILSLAALAGAIWFMGLAGNLIRLVVIAAMLAYILDPVVGLLEARGTGRLLATIIVFLLIVGIITIFVFMLLPHVSAELKTIREGISAGKAADLIHRAEITIEGKLGFLGVGDLDLVDKLQSYTRQAGNQIYGYFLNAVAILTNLLIIPFIMFFFLKDGRDFIKDFVSLIPNQYFEMTLSLMHKTDKQLGGYIRGTLLDSAIIGGLAIVALWLLDVKYFFLLGVVLGISNMVPFIGPIVGSVPAIAMALIETGSVAKALYVTLAMVIVQIIDSGIVKPIVIARMVSLHPVIIILVVILGGKLFGVMGMILSVPATGIVKLIYQEASSNIRKYRYNY